MGSTPPEVINDAAIIVFLFVALIAAVLVLSRG
jgi:hypothetical protein